MTLIKQDLANKVKDKLMNNLTQNLYITYSNQRARDLKEIINPLDKVITLDSLILEIFESDNFEIVIDDTIGSSIIYKIIQDNDIQYFNYLDSDAVSLNTIYSFLVKSKRNGIEFNSLLEGEKLDAITTINNAYQEYKQKNSLSDISDIEQNVLDNWNNSIKDNYSEVYIDNFNIEDISLIKSKIQEQILKKVSQYQPISQEVENITKPKIIKPSNEVFDNIDEVKTAIKITRRLLEDGVCEDEILIVASDIQEYAPLYKLFLDEYDMKGYSSQGTSLSSYFNKDNPQVKIALNNYNLKMQSLEIFYKKLGLKLSDTAKQNIKSSINILDEKIGIELTEPNQIVGLNKKYKHIVFIGTDINHFPPKSNDNFLYSYEDDLKYFYANNYFKSSQIQYSELKRLCDNLYIVTASHSGKRELVPSIIIDGDFDDTIDISDIKSVNQLALENKTIITDENTSNYYESITSDDFTKYDGDEVVGFEATHLSASQINNYISCPLKYLYSSKIKLQVPNQSEEGFDVMEQGSLMHLCYELFGRYIKDNKIESTNQDELYKLMFDISLEAYNHEETVKKRNEENIHHKIFLSSLQAGLQDDREAGLLSKFVNYYIVNASELEYFQNTEFEKEFALDNELKPYLLKDKNDKNYFIKGFIDRFDNLDGCINIVDYKSKKVKNVDKKKQEEVDIQKDIQLALYILYAKQQYPNKIYDSYLLSFKGNDKGVSFASLSNEDLYDEDYENDLKKLIFDTRDSIENGEFRFDNSDEKMCGWCDIKNICHESVLNKLKENNNG